MKTSLSEQLLGTWHLEDFTETPVMGGEKRYPFGEHPQGFLIYTDGGFMSAQLMKVGHRKFVSDDWSTGTPDEYREESIGYISYAGTYDVDVASNTVTHHISVALYPNWINSRQKRQITLDRDRLILQTQEFARSDGVNVVSHLYWKR